MIIITQYDVTNCYKLKKKYFSKKSLLMRSFAYFQSWTSSISLCVASTRHQIDWFLGYQLIFKHLELSMHKKNTYLTENILKQRQATLLI